MNYSTSVLLAVVLFSTIGCESFSGVREDNPVVGPPPPRVASRAELEADSRNYANLTPVSNTRPSGQNSILQTDGGQRESNVLVKRIANSEMVATVNGTVILASDVLAPFQGRLQQAKDKMPADLFEKERLKLLKSQLPAVIEQEMLVEAMKSKVSPEQLESFEKQLDESFANEHVKGMLKRTNSGTSKELDEKLRAQGNSLASLRKAFGKKQMALFYLFGEANTKRTLSRSDLIVYYKEHADEYTHPAKAKWQEVSVSFAKHGGKGKAAQIVKQAILELQQGVRFGEVAKKYSNGATATNGGNWDWTERESLADSNIGTLIFTLPVDQVSDVYLGEKAFKIIKVTERQEKTVTPLAELQDQIKLKIESSARNIETKAVIERLKRETVIRTVFDER